MSANPEPTVDPKASNLSEQEKIQEFIRALALAFRRITGRVGDNDLEGLPVDMGEKTDESEEASGKPSSEKQKPEDIE
jgi:hypothetical protein